MNQLEVRMMRKPGTVVVIFLIVALLVIAAACGEDATPTPLPATAVPAPTAVPSAPAPTEAPAHGSPLPILKFGDVDYVPSGYAELPSGEGTVFVIDGI